jgi:hypothetical protein
MHRSKGVLNVAASYFLTQTTNWILINSLVSVRRQGVDDEYEACR